MRFVRCAASRESVIGRPAELQAEVPGSLECAVRDEVPGIGIGHDDVAKAVDEIQFRAEFKKRLVTQLNAWMDRKEQQ